MLTQPADRHAVTGPGQASRPDPAKTQLPAQYAGAAIWAGQGLSHEPDNLASIYTMRSEWSAAKAAIDNLPASMRSHVRWWIADPTGYAHVVPGSDATQWYWGSSYDITTATPRF